jgi:hypothetical protein
MNKWKSWLGKIIKKRLVLPYNLHLEATATLELATLDLGLATIRQFGTILDLGSATLA